MQHTAFLTFKAKNNYELGLQLGETFGEKIRSSLQKAATEKNWSQKVDRSIPYLEITQKYFPQYIEEQKGYAEKAGVDFREFWTRSLEDELDQEKCTTIITNNGRLASHNEDWAPGTQDLLYLVKKTIGELTVFEFFYYATLGGNSISVNSRGILQSVNTLTSGDHQIGIPRNVTCRFLSEIENVEKGYEKFSALSRASGYNHNFTNIIGEIYNIESSAKQQELRKISSPFVHTNHFLGSLQSFDECHGICGTYQRYNFAKSHVKPQMNIEELQDLTSDTSQGLDESLMNERTIGKMIVDFDQMAAYVWMLREDEKGWIEYPLDFIR